MSQFHYGSITTSNDLVLYENLIKSQFHYGSITTNFIMPYSSDIFKVSIPLWFDYNEVKASPLAKNTIGLNSTMVRLQQIMQAPPSGRPCMSQFHYGSITTAIEHERTYKAEIVSIPLWFDYNKYY